MKKVEKSVADAYFRERIRWTVGYLIIWAIVSYGVVLFAEPLSNLTFLGFPFHYYMGAQGAVLTFIVLLFVNAVVTDKIDEKYGINEEKNKQLSEGKTVDH